MFRFPQKILQVSTNLVVPVARNNNLVLSEPLAQAERACYIFCPPPPKTPLQKVTVVGAGSDVGRIVCLFLKQQPVIKILALYDHVPENKVIGIATDVSHIDTSTRVEGYDGKFYLRDALKELDSFIQSTWCKVRKNLQDANVVLICGGCFIKPQTCDTPDHDIFMANMHLVRTTMLAIAKFCPDAVVAVQTPPVDANFAMAVHTMKVNKVYNSRKVLGVNAINAMRANQLFCSLTGTDSSRHSIPVVGGTCRTTRVPVFSAGKAGNFPTNQSKCLTRLVREADEIICKVKNNCEQGHLSIGFATARFVTNVMTGLFQNKAFIDSALVEQGDPTKCYGLKYCSTPISICEEGICEYAVPVLSEAEQSLLECSKCDFKDYLHLGKCFARGDDYHPLACRIKLPKPPPCPLGQNCPNICKKIHYAP